MTTTVITHSNCNDGTMAVYYLIKDRHVHVDHVIGCKAGTNTYLNLIPLTCDKVIFVDIMPKEEDIKLLAEKYPAICAQTIEIYDHHEISLSNEIIDTHNIILHHDISECATTVVTDRRDPITLAIKGRDLNLKEYDTNISLGLNDVIFKISDNVYTLDELADPFNYMEIVLANPDVISSMGKISTINKEANIKSVIKNGKWVKLFDFERVFMIDGKCGLITDVNNRVDADLVMSIQYSLIEHRWWLSFRSKNEQAYMAMKIIDAMYRQTCGGGHKNACGTSVPDGFIDFIRFSD